MALILDFDGTITVKDTIATLAKIGLETQKARGNDLSAAWDNVIKQYGMDCERLDAAYRPAAAARTTLEQEIAYLAAREEVEIRSIRRVEESGIFRNMTPADWLSAGGKALETGDVQIRAGLRELVEHAAHAGRKVSIISVNWSTSFIRGVLGAGCTREVDIVANEITADGIISGPELLRRRRSSAILATSADKLAAMKAVVAEAEPMGLESPIYFGDSSTDLQCLLESRGIVIAESGDSILLRTFSRVGHSIPHVSSTSTGNNLYWAANFTEVLKSGRIDKGA